MTHPPFFPSHLQRFPGWAVDIFITEESMGLPSRLNLRGKRWPRTYSAQFTGNCMLSQTSHLFKKTKTIGKERQTWKSPPLRFYSWQDNSVIFVICLKVEFSCTWTSSKTSQNINSLDFTLFVLMWISHCGLTLLCLYWSLICCSFLQLLLDCSCWFWELIIIFNSNNIL